VPPRDGGRLPSQPSDDVRNFYKTSGLPAQNGTNHVDDQAPVAAPELPPRPAWLSDALLAETVEVWAAAYGRAVTEAEALEILMNVRRLAEALLKAKKEAGK